MSMSVAFGSTCARRVGVKKARVLHVGPHVPNVVDIYDLLNICNHMHWQWTN